MGGSILGGRWSDRVLTKLKAKNGGRGNAEVSNGLHHWEIRTHELIYNSLKMRLESTKLAMIFLPLTSIAYGWFCEKKIHIAAVCVALFLAGFFSM